MMNTTTGKRNVLFILLILFLVAAAVPAAAGGVYKQADDEIPEYGVTGKTEEAPGSQPWTVALVEDGYDARDGQFCGGTLIAPQWVLTAAHCIEETAADEVDVVVGRYQLSSSQGERIDADRLIPHPQYGEFHDIALIHLARPATAVQPIALVTAVTEYLDDPPTVAHIAGWGIIPEKGEEYSPDKLSGVDVPIVTEAQCQAAYGSDVDSSVICAGLEQGGADSCSGDSGGPLVVPAGDGWALAGVVSWGDGCGLPGKYGVYTRVASYEAWIAGYLNGSSPVEPPAEETAADEPDWSDWLDGWFGDGETAVDEDNPFAEDDPIDEDSFTETIDLGAYDGPVAELAVEGVGSELVTIGGVEMLLEDWSDGYGPYFIGVLVVDGRLLEIHSTVSAEAVMDAAQALLR
jgi:hypothetical protein